MVRTMPDTAGSSAILATARKARRFAPNATARSGTRASSAVTLPRAATALNSRATTPFTAGQMPWLNLARHGRAWTMRWRRWSGTIPPTRVARSSLAVTASRATSACATARTTQAIVTKFGTTQRSGVATTGPAPPLAVCAKTVGSGAAARFRVAKIRCTQQRSCRMGTASTRGARLCRARATWTDTRTVSQLDLTGTLVGRKATR